MFKSVHLNKRTMQGISMLNLVDELTLKLEADSQITEFGTANGIRDVCHHFEWEPSELIRLEKLISKTYDFPAKA